MIAFEKKVCFPPNPMPKVEYTFDDKLLQLSRYDVSRYVSLITGHGNLAYFLSKLESDVNPICRFCGERNETFIHLTECPRLRDYQVDSFLGRIEPGNGVMNRF